jgi:inorganic pyrophosphatase
MAKSRPARKPVWIIIETPKGSRCKFKFDPEESRFQLKHILPAGAMFPYDFGFIPDTKGADGDPLDVLLLLDVPTFPGCAIESRLIGVLEAEQTDDKGTIRNDRLIAVSTEARNQSHVTGLQDLNEHLIAEIEHFFVSYNEMRDRNFRVLGRRGSDAALELVADGRRGARRKREKSSR